MMIVHHRSSKGGSTSLLLFLPVLCFFAALCEAKSSRITSANGLDRIEPPKGMEWMDMVEADESAREQQRIMWRRSAAAKSSRRNNGRKKSLPLTQRRNHDLFTVDFTPSLQNEQRYDNSILEFVAADSSVESNEQQMAAMPVPWFDEWERMVAAGEKKKRKNTAKKQPVGSKQKPRKSAIKWIKDFLFDSPPALMDNHRHSMLTKNPIPVAVPVVQPTRRQFRNLRSPCLLRTEHPVEHRTYPRSWEHPGFEAALPREWDWRNVSGQNFCSPNRNQHIPVYCGGCWVFGTLGSLNDRFNIARKNRWPMTNLSPQEIIACNGNGSCNGGTAENVMVHAREVGLVEEGCNNYKAVNEKCTPFARCGSCWPDNCFAIENYTRYYIKDFGKLSGRLQMMSEIHNRGPIACSMGCTSKFDLNYTGGIYQEFGDFPVNHIVSVTGWGWDEDTKTEYWIVRNSWGDAWGEDGWFRVVTSLYKGGRGDQYNMGIERECYFADPDVSNLN